MKTLLGYKQNQTQMFTSDGKRIPVTNILVGPCYVTANEVRNNWQITQLGFGTCKHISKATQGKLKKAGLTNKLRFFRSFKSNVNEEAPVPGKELNISDIFNIDDKIAVTGISKGKGFAGVVKRHNFRGGPRTHGQSDRERAPGSIGQTTTPGRVYRGKRMAGRMGNDRVTVKGLKIVNIDADKKIMTVSGLIPGGRNSLIYITKIV